MRSDIEQRAQELLDAHCPIDYNRALTGANVAIFKRAALDAIAAALASQAQEPAAVVPEDVRRAGAMLSNCAYNLAQRQHLTDDERRSLDESRQAWDAAIAAAPAPEVDRG